MAVFVNRLTVTGPTDRFEDLYAQIAAFMQTQPGLVRFMLVRSTKAADVYFNIAEWEDQATFKASIATPEFQKLFAELKPIIVGDPHLSETVLYGTAEPAAQNA